MRTKLSETPARKELYRLLEGLKDLRAPLQITWKRGKAVLVSEEDWRSIQETLYVLSLPGMRDSISKGLKIPVGKCSKELRW